MPMGYSFTPFFHSSISLPLLCWIRLISPRSPTAVCIFLPVSVVPNVRAGTAWNDTLLQRELTFRSPKEWTDLLGISAGFGKLRQPEAGTEMLGFSLHHHSHDMNWGQPSALIALWLLPVLAFLLVRAHRRRQQLVTQFVDRAMADRLMPQLPGSRAAVRAVLLLTGCALLILALARPQFGEYFEDVSTRGVDVVVALDVSRSMMAEDVKPNRLERAKSDILDLLNRLEGDRVGLVLFAGAPVVQVPLTTDLGFYKSMLRDADPNSAPRGGTLIGDAIRKCLNCLEERADRDQAIILITDGGDQDSFPTEAAQQAAARGIRMITVGLGDISEGARIPERDEQGSLRFVQHDGEVVWSKMDENLLKELAVATEGAYVPARTLRYDLGQIYDDHLARLTQSELSTAKRRHLHERFQWFAAGGILLILIQMMISEQRSESQVLRARAVAQMGGQS